MRSFFGLCNVFRRFVPNFSRIAALLNKKFRMKEPGQFQTRTAPEKNTVEQLKFQLASPIVLGLLQADGHLTIDTGTCDTQPECVLLEKQQDGTMTLTGYWSRTLVEPEMKLTTTHKRCRAVVWAILLLRPYLEGKLSTFRTDHNAVN